MAGVAALWGILWIALQHHSNSNTQRELNAPHYQKPQRGKWVLLSRTKQGFSKGWLVTDHEQLFFYKGDIQAQPGESLSLPTDAFTPIATLDNIKSIKHLAGMWGNLKAL
jgi:hypothetical protein